jgi:ketosteroid isomerase-like protein
MPEENVEIVRRLFDAWNRSDFDAGLALCDSDVVIDRSRSLLDARVYRGIDEVAGFTADWTATWATTQWEIDKLIDAGDDVVVLGRFHGRGVKSGAAVEATFAQVMTVRDGKLVRGVLFQTRADALEAAGLSE